MERNKIFELSPDHSTVTIKDMGLDHVGNYECEIKNPFNRQIFKTTVSLAGLGENIRFEKLN